jgi:hypothetical protein
LSFKDLFEIEPSGPGESGLGGFFYFNFTN